MRFIALATAYAGAVGSSVYPGEECTALSVNGDDYWHDLEFEILRL